MARLNIEDSFWLEVTQLIAKTGDQDRAIGNALRFFRHAQEKHKHGLLVSEDEFRRLGFLDDLIPLFAERTEGGIKAIGADKHFGWLAAKVESGRRGGKVGGLAAAGRERDENGRLLSKANQSEPKQSQSETGSAKPSPSPSPSFSNSLSSVGCTDVILTSVPNESVRQTIKIESAEEIRAVINEKTMATFAKLYSPEYVDREIEKSALWLSANPKKNTKTKRGWQAFLAGWLDRGWAKHVTQLPSSPPKKSASADEIANRLIQEHESKRQGA